MCNHSRKQLETYPDDNGFINEKCLDCKEIIRKIPGTYEATMNYCKEKKINIHIKNPVDRLSEYEAPNRDKLSRTMF
jgi:hypothetical protein